jgi:inner membrane protein
MDNVCHTLVGAAMAEAGLKKYTPYATPVLMIAANIPDLDVLVFVTDIPPVSFRRGWTHGVVGQALLPIGLTLAVMAWARWRGRPVRAAWVLALSYLALYSHLFLDFLNNYGVRLLAPIEWRWFHGDAVFCGSCSGRGCGSPGDGRRHNRRGWHSAPRPATCWSCLRPRPSRARR